MNPHKTSRRSTPRGVVLWAVLAFACCWVAPPAQADVPAADELTEWGYPWGGSAVIEYSQENVAEGWASILFTAGSTTVMVHAPATIDADWDLHAAGITHVTLQIWAESIGGPNAFLTGSPTIMLHTATGLRTLVPQFAPLADAWSQWATVVVPIAGDEDWLCTDAGVVDLAHVRSFRILYTTEVTGSQVWLDGLAFIQGPPPGFSPNVYWSGPGGDVWNTSSSPEIVDATNPFNVMWSSQSQDEGEFTRASGVVLASVGEAGTPYLFGSTGWWQNRAYRRNSLTGAATPWVTQSGQNDSGTGYRVALAVDGSVLYHIDDGNRIRAYPTATNPEGIPLWTADGEAEHMRRCVKVGPDNRIYGQCEVSPARIAALEPANGTCVWWQDNCGAAPVYPGAFLEVNGTWLYVVAGTSRYVVAYDISQPPNSPPAWSFYDAVEAGFSPPVVDPQSGSIYIFRWQRLIKLNAQGQLVWRSPAVSAGEYGRAYGSLSRDGATFYYQTGSPDDNGRLYAFRTSDGSIKWTYLTQARADGDCISGPVVSANGVVFVGNYGRLQTGRDNRLYCIEDSAGVAPALRGTFDLNDIDVINAPCIAIGPGGVVYFDGWAAPDNPRVFACVSHPQVLLPPEQQRVAALNASALVRWQPLDNPGQEFARYVIYRSTQPFTSVAGLSPIGDVDDPEAASFLDDSADNGTAYWYAVTTRTTGGGEIAEVVGIGPCTPRDITDVQVVTIARTPRFPRYDAQYTDYDQVDLGGYGPYTFSAATGLGSGQSPETPRWPTIGDQVTYTATVRNCGTNGGPVEMTIAWHIDGATIATENRTANLSPGGTTTFQVLVTWDGIDHEVEFAVETDQTEVGLANNSRKVTMRSVGFLTYVDESHGAVFREETADYPQAQTDDIVDWLNHHMDRFNAMFADAGSAKRVHYEVLEILDDFAEDPVVDRLPFAVFPFRLHWNEANYRHTGWYNADHDIDYGLLHEEGHQLGLIDIYHLNLGPEQNLVNGTGYSGPPCLMNACSPFLSEHSARAMDHWYETAHGYFGQYLYCMPEQVQLRLLGMDDSPLAGASITVYQKAHRSSLGHVITEQVRAQGTADDAGIVTLPNVPIDPAEIPPTAAGDELHANPFGNVAVVGTNGVLLIKVEHEGFTDWCWLDITEVNNAYWNGQTQSAVFERQLALGGPLQHFPPSDLAELNAADWRTWAEQGTITLTDDTDRVRLGSGSIKGVFTGGFDNYLRYPGHQLAIWDLTQATHLRIWFFAENDYGFQSRSPWVRLNSSGGSILYQTQSDILNESIGQWYEAVIPLAGDPLWERTDYGTPSLDAVSSLDIHADTWDYGFTLWIDGVRFEPQPGTAVDPGVTASAFSLGQAWPNPFNPRTEIAYTIAHPGRVKMTIFDLRGRLVRRLVDADLAAGAGSVVWDGSDEEGRDAASGVYLCRLEEADHVLARKLVLVR